jgi:hypothetical protein
MNTHSSYTEFLHAKIAQAPSTGIEVPLDAINPLLKPHTRDIVRWALRGGRRAIFASFGLHKTATQIECMRLIGIHRPGLRLLCMPLGVRQEFKREVEQRFKGENAVDQRFIRCDSEIGDERTVYMTNYESIREGKLNPAQFRAASLDEASVLRSYGSKTYQEFLPAFASVRFKFVATATPSPNRFKELIHYAGYLGVMDTGQALTRFFQRDSEKAGNLTLYPHKEREFWLWVASWAVFIQRPSDLGHSDDGYLLPELDVRYHEVPSDYAAAGAEKNGQVLLIPDLAMGLSATAREKRLSLPARVARVRELIDADPADHFVVWHDLEDERHALQCAIPEAVSVWGSQDLEEREQRIVDFGNGQHRILSTKPIIAGSGCNFQRHCHREIFAGVGFKFNDFIQAIHRVHRFGQSRRVRIDIVHTEAEREVLRTLQQKWTQHEEMQQKMTEIICEYGLNRAAMQEALTRTIGVERIEVKSDLFTVANNDCVDEARRQPEGSVDLIVTSIPFANHYEYSPSYNDFGHTTDNAHFWAQMDFLTPQLLRILKPGRIYACHVKDRINFGNVTGAGLPTVSPFHAEALFHGLKHGFDYLGMITVVTDVVRENNQTYRLGYTEMCKDGSKMGVGSPEYVLLFHKPQTDRSRGYADSPIRKTKDDYSLARWQVDAHAFWRSSGNRMLTAEEMAGYGPGRLAKMFTEFSMANVYDYEFHIRIGEELQARGALPSDFMSLAPGSHHPEVWHDVTRMLTLNSEQSRRAVEKHVCLARGSLVLTRRGFVPIQDVAVGDLVLTHEGRWRAVQVVSNTGVRPVVNLHAQGVAALAMTPEHKVWARTSSWERARDGAERAHPDWLRADESMGAYVNLKLPPVEDSSLTEQECWILGRWLADGHVGVRGDFYVSVGPEKLPEFDRIAAQHAGSRVERTAIQVRLKALHPLMIAMLKRCGTGAGEKQVPVDLLGLSVDKARSLLNGYLSGDGHFVTDRGTWMATSVSRALLLGISMLAQRVHGAVVNLRAGRPAGSTIIEGRQVKTRQEWVLSFDVDGARRKSPFILDDGAWKKVRSVDVAGEMETWCLRVEEDASFTTEGCIVANCPLQFDIVDRLIDRYSMPGELVYDPFHGLGTVGVRAIKKGRRAGGSELNAAYFFDQVHYLRAAEREAAMPTLFGFEKPDRVECVAMEVQS